MKYFLWSIFLPSADSRRAVVSFWQRNVHKHQLNSYPGKKVVRQTDWLDMTIIVLNGLLNSNPTNPYI